MIAHVTDCADSTGAVSTRRPLSSVSRWNVLTAAMLTARARSPVPEPVDEANRLPGRVDRRALVVDEARVQADPLHGVEIEVGLDLRGLLRPRDPEPIAGLERVLQ